jgi:hypothetical protein
LTGRRLSSTKNRQQQRDQYQITRFEVVVIACRPYDVDVQFGATDSTGFSPANRADSASLAQW